MIKVRDDRDQVNIAKVYRAKQDHVLRFWEDLGPEERRTLLDQLDRIDFQLVTQLIGSLDERARVKKLEPPEEPVRLPDCLEAPAWAEAVALGREAFARGQVAGVIVAGGQGTRLGHPGPKGTFEIGPVTKRSLFQVFAEKALAIARRYRSSFPLYVMTSVENAEATAAFWREHDHFGLSAAEVRFFPQRQLPAVDHRGRIILTERGRLAMSPNGHGGVLEGLAGSGALEDMARRGVELVSYWQVDNPLVRVDDPAFLGAMLDRGAEAGAKCVGKRAPQEPVGVWARVDGRMGVVEYSELGDEETEARTESGALRYRAANIAVHAFRRDFLERVIADGETLPYHRAEKRIPYVDRHATRHEPEEPNGVKFERFIFDAFREARSVLLCETERAREFGPVKNRDGDDSPQSCRRALNELYAGWLEANGARVSRDADGTCLVPIEISPLVATGPQDLERRIEDGLTIDRPFSLDG